MAKRVTTYQIEVSAASEQYMKNILTLPAMQRWYEAALAETEVLGQFEMGTDVD